MKKIFIFLVMLALSSCGSGNSSSDSSTDDTVDNNSAYTLVAGTPFVGESETGAQFYNDLLRNLSPTQDNVPASRLLLAVENPTQNDIFTIGDTVTNSGLAVQFLYSLAQTNSSGRIEVYTFLDVELNESGWTEWTPPVADPAINSCSSISDTVDVNQQNVLKSICWTSLVNQLIASESSGLVASRGVAYDGQGMALSDSDENRAWIESYTVQDSLKLGWISSGLKSSVNLNLIEVYDLYKGNHDSIRIDTVAPETVSGLVTGITPVCSGDMCSYSGIFPGLQWIFESTTGAVGANIYQCAISASESELAANSCDSSYTNNVNTESGPDEQMLQSLNYIFLFTSQAPLSSNIYGAPPSPALANNEIVYLFSTQYIGPAQSYAGSNQQCIESGADCSCVASIYDAHASCGNENGFGTWGANLLEFRRFTDKFLASQTPCTAPGGCGVGIYMYDFIPQQWYTQQ